MRHNPKAWIRNLDSPEADTVHQLSTKGWGRHRIAAATNMTPAKVQRILAALAASGRSPRLTPGENPAGCVMGKTTIQIGATGQVEREWRRVYPQAESIEDWLSALCERAAKAGPKIAPPKRVSGTLLAEVPIGDLHAGMYAWAAETGTDYDIETAARMFRDGVARLVDTAAKAGARDLVLADLGDFLHTDNRHGMTERGGNILDTDTRYQRVIAMARDAWVDVIAYAAKRFESVQVFMVPGNHNFQASYWMGMVVQAWFRGTKHVRVCTDPKTYRFHRFGQVLLGYCHGHLIKANQLAAVMATGAKREWADTTHHHWRCGHIHHSVRELYRDRDESDGVTVEYFPTLAGRDAYHAEHGYLSRRLLQCILYDPIDGEVARHTVSARMLSGG